MNGNCGNGEDCYFEMYSPDNDWSAHIEQYKTHYFKNAVTLEDLKNAHADAILEKEVLKQKSYHDYS